MEHPTIRQVTLRQYKSIEACTLDLAPLTILVGRNGAGKSNVLDALRFLTEALRNTLEYAIRERGGIDQVRRKSLGGRPTNPGISVDITLPEGQRATYTFRIAAVQGRAFRVDREECRVFSSSGKPVHAYALAQGQVTEWTPAPHSPAPSIDRLYLVAASGLPEFRPVYDVLTRMTFLNLNPELMKYPQRPEPGGLLAHDGRNFASVVKQLGSAPPEVMERVLEYVRAVGVPLTRVEHKQAGALETVEVAQERRVPEGTRNATFDAISLSDGTIRALGVLVALASARADARGGPTLIGIEEPETALHPAAAGSLMDALLEGAEATQLLITSHSPDLLEHASVTPDMIRPVILEDGRTRVGTLSPRKAALLKEHLATAGELLRLDQLEPDAEELDRREQAAGTFFKDLA